MESNKQCLTLSKKDLSKSLSARKKQRKTFKHVLMSPFSASFKKIAEGSSDLEAALERLLPLARIGRPIGEASAKPKPEEVRKCLAVGVNAVNRHLYKNNISAVLLASDIEPESLVSHVIEKCQRDMIPILRHPKFRAITKNCLGFEGIAIGFVKNSNLFNEIIEYAKRDSLPASQSIMAISSRSLTFATPSPKNHILSCEPKENKKEFQYFKRSNSSKRAFVPENCSEEIAPTGKSQTEFISIKDQSFLVDSTAKQGLSLNVCKRPAQEELQPQKMHKKSKQESVLTFIPAQVNHIVGNIDRRRKSGKT